MINNEKEDITHDTFYKGKVIVHQHKKGYRFSIDAPLLADFLPCEPAQKALEIGTGSGIVSLLALYKKKFSFIYGVEIQEKLSRLAELNANKNGFSNKFKVIPADFNEIFANKKFTGIRHIFSNPPFLGTDMGRLSPNKEIRDAKFETVLRLEELLKKSYAILSAKDAAAADREPVDIKKSGNLYLILPYNRFTELELSARKTGFFINSIRLIFSFKIGKPERFLVQLTNNTVSPVTLDPLVIFKEIGKYTEEIENVFAGR
jgi:tRNA1Val (adenine37-N6)-methyltransferase